MQTLATSPIKSIPPALIGAALDCLAQLPDGHRLCPALLRSVAHVIGCDRADTPALLARIRATAIIMNDPRWPPWSAHFQTCTAEQRQVFETALLGIIAGLPLLMDLTFHADAFFDALLAGAMPHGGSECPS
jgi:hypothetical protein